MKTNRLRPKVVLWWGIATTAGAALLVMLVPSVLNVYGNAGTQGLQDFYTVVGVLLQLASIVLPPLGGALIGAGIVMAYVQRILSSHAAPIGSSDNPTL